MVTYMNYNSSLIAAMCAFLGLRPVFRLSPTFHILRRLVTGIFFSREGREVHSLTLKVKVAEHISSGLFLRVETHASRFMKMNHLILEK